MATTSDVVHLHHDPDLASALAELSVKLRSVVVLRLLLDYPERETAEALGLSVGTAKSRLHRGLARLREKLGDHHADHQSTDPHPAADRMDEEQSS